MFLILYQSTGKHEVQVLDWCRDNLSVSQIKYGYFCIGNQVSAQTQESTSKKAITFHNLDSQGSTFRFKRNITTVTIMLSLIKNTT